MTDTNSPVSDETIREIADHLENAHRDQSIAGRLSISNTRALTGVRDSFVTFVTPLSRLQSSFKRMDETNRKITQMGTTYTKLRTSLEKNSNVLNQSNVSNRALIAEIAKNYEHGVRINNGALTDLTKEMISTGQNVALQRTMNANAILQTGNNTAAVQKINKTNVEVSDKYGISNDRLIESLNSLKDTMDSVSIFGPQAVTAFSTISQEIQGRAGGQDVAAATQTLLEIMTPGVEKLAASQLLGAGGSRARTAAGLAPDMEDAKPILKRVQELADNSTGQFKAEIAASKAGLSKQQFIQLRNLANIMDSDFALSKDVQVTEKEKYNSLKNLQDKQNDWYDYGANVMLGLLGQMSTSLLTVAGFGMQAGGAARTLYNLGTGGTGGVNPSKSPVSPTGVAGVGAGAVAAALTGKDTPKDPLRDPATGIVSRPSQRAAFGAEGMSGRIGDRYRARLGAGSFKDLFGKNKKTQDAMKDKGRGGITSSDVQEMLGGDEGETASQRRLRERRAARPKGRMDQMKGGLKSGLKGPMGGMAAGMAAGAIGEATGFDMTGTQMGASIGSFIPGVGTAAGAGIGFLVDIAKNTFGSSESAKERVRQEKEKVDRERAESATRDERRLAFLTGFLRSRSQQDPIDVSQQIGLQEELVRQTRKVAENTAKNGVSALGKG